MCNAFADWSYEDLPPLHDILQASALKSRSSMSSLLHLEENRLRFHAQFRSRYLTHHKSQLEKKCPICSGVVASETLIPHVVFRHGTQDLYQHVVDGMGNPDLSYDFKASILVECLCGASFSGSAWQVFQDLEQHILKGDTATHQALYNLGSRIHLGNAKVVDERCC